MTRVRPAIVALIVAVVGSWGCARSTGTHASGHLDRIKLLESKNAKLEADFRAVAATKDQLRKKLAAVEAEQQQLREQLNEQVQALTRQRDELRNEVAKRTGERDAMSTQYEQFRKNIRELLGQAEASLNPPADQPPVTKASSGAVPGES